MANRGGKEAKSGPIDSSRFAGRGGAIDFWMHLSRNEGRERDEKSTCCSVLTGSATFVPPFVLFEALEIRVHTSQAYV
jgi:hypothetical protein